TGLPATANQGDVVTATITVTNNGPDFAKNAQLVTTLGPGLTPASTGGPSARGAIRAGTRINLPSLPNGGTAAFTIKLRPAGTGATTSTASVHGGRSSNVVSTPTVASITVSPTTQSSA